jgi:transposase
MKALFAYGTNGTNYLIDTKEAVIVDFEATPARWGAEVVATVRRQRLRDSFSGLKNGGFLAHRNHRGVEMSQKSGTTKLSSERIVKDIRRATRKQYSAEEKIRIVLDGLRGEHSIAELCRREGIAESLYYTWSKEFLEAGKRRLAGDTARAATSGEVKDLRREARALKEVVAEQALDLRLLKKSMIADGGGEE